jgi:hypothetical protein
MINSLGEHSAMISPEERAKLESLQALMKPESDLDPYAKRYPPESALIKAHFPSRYAVSFESTYFL